MGAKRRKRSPRVNHGENRRTSVAPSAWDRREALDDPWDQEDSRLIRLQQRGGLLNRVKAAVLKAFNYVIRLRGSPEEIAWGLSIGLFIAMTPTIGLQMAIAVPVATALRGNPAAAAAACWLTNPLTIPFFYGLTYWIGARILGYNHTFRVRGELTLDMLLSQGNHVWWSLIVGGVILGLFSAVVSYYPVLFMVRAGRETLRKQRERHRERRERRQAHRSAKSRNRLERELITTRLEPEA